MLASSYKLLATSSLFAISVFLDPIERPCARPVPIKPGFSDLVGITAARQTDSSRNNSNAMKLLLTLLLAATAAQAVEWPHLKTTFGIEGIGVAFDPQPREGSNKFQKTTQNTFFAT